MAREFMPIMGSELLKAIPLAMLDEANAQANHGQTLERLAQRGGLGVTEALCIILGYRWGALKPCPHNDGVLLYKMGLFMMGKAEPIQGGSDGN